MTQLRKMMLEELQRRNYSQTTVKGYLRVVEDFAQHFHRPPDQLGPEQIRAVSGVPVPGEETERRHGHSSTAALRFFFCKTLKRRYLLEEVPYPKRPAPTADDPEPGRGSAD